MPDTALASYFANRRVDERGWIYVLGTLAEFERAARSTRCRGIYAETHELGLVTVPKITFRERLVELRAEHRAGQATRDLAAAINRDTVFFDTDARERFAALPQQPDGEHAATVADGNGMGVAGAVIPPHIRLLRDLFPQSLEPITVAPLHHVLRHLEKTEFERLVRVLRWRDSETGHVTARLTRRGLAVAAQLPSPTPPPS